MGEPKDHRSNPLHPSSEQAMSVYPLGVNPESASTQNEGRIRPVIDVLTTLPQPKYPLRARIISPLNMGTKGQSAGPRQVRFPSNDPASYLVHMTYREVQDHIFSFKLGGLPYDGHEDGCRVCGQHFLPTDSELNRQCTECTKDVSPGESFFYASYQSQGTCGAHTRIQADGEYERVELAICSPCFEIKGPRGNYGGGRTRSAFKLEFRRSMDGEWVNCDGCHRKVHTTCGLYCKFKDTPTAPYYCPFCDMHLKRVGKGYGQFSSRLPIIPQRLMTCQTSKGLEHHVNTFLRNQLSEVAEMVQDNPIHVRLLSCNELQVEVERKMLRSCFKGNYPSAFPYRTKTITAFQKQEGNYVMLALLLVKEFRADLPIQNKGKVYVEAVKAIEGFAPDGSEHTKILSTIITRQLLVHYLYLAEVRGFNTAYINLRGPENLQKALREKDPKVYPRDFEKELGSSLLSQEYGFAGGKPVTLDEWFGTRPTPLQHLPNFSGGILFFSSGEFDALRNCPKGVNVEESVQNELKRKIEQLGKHFIVVPLEACAPRPQSGGSSSSSAGVSQNLNPRILAPMDMDPTIRGYAFDTPEGFATFCQDNSCFFDTLHTSKFATLNVIFASLHPTILTRLKLTCGVCDCPLDTGCMYSNHVDEPADHICVDCYEHELEIKSTEIHKYQRVDTVTLPRLTTSMAEQEGDVSRIIEGHLMLLTHTSTCKNDECYKMCMELKAATSHLSGYTDTTTATSTTSSTIGSTRGNCQGISICSNLYGGCRTCTRVWKLITAHAVSCPFVDCKVPYCIMAKAIIRGGREGDEQTSNKHSLKCLK